jgi:16S rRNA processing protein RimM
VLLADAWGIQGWFRVLPYSAAPEALFSSKRWFLRPAEKGAAPSRAPCA